MPTPVIVLACLGLIGIVAGVAALLRNWARSKSADPSAHWRRWLIICLVTGLLLGVASWPLTYWMGYPIHVEAEPGRVVGFPFFVAYFDSEGRDYVGPLMMLGVVANAIFWLLAPQLALYFIARRAPKNVRT